MGRPCRCTASVWVSVVTFSLVTLSATVIGAADSADNSRGDLENSKAAASSLPQLLEETRSPGIHRPALSDAFKPAVAEPLLEPRLSRTPSISGLSSSRDFLAQGLDLAPSNPLAMPGNTEDRPRGSNRILITPQLLRGLVPLIPGLDGGYLYHFGRGVSTGRLTFDYLLPVGLGRDSVVFGEAHGEFTDFWRTVSSLWQQVDTTPQYITTTTTTRESFNERIDLSFGGGYRRIFDRSTLLGVNGFYDTTRLGNRWYPSGGLGLEFAALLPGSDALELTFNWYGNLFNSNVLANAFRLGPSNYDFQAGYLHEIWHDGPDLRLGVTGYRFSAGTGVYGVKGGTELSTRNGMFTLKYEAAHDRVNRTYHTIGGFVNVGLRLSNLLQGESPFVLPEPIFRSPRNLRRWLTQKTRRNRGAPAAIVLARSSTSQECVNTMSLSGTFTVINHTDFHHGQVPDISGCGFTTVVIRWRDLTPDGNRYQVYFRFFDGNQLSVTSPIFDMGAASGSVTRALNQYWDSRPNRVHYASIWGGDLVAAGGEVVFEFY